SDANSALKVGAERRNVIKEAAIHAKDSDVRLRTRVRADNNPGYRWKASGQSYCNTVNLYVWRERTDQRGLSCCQVDRVDFVVKRQIHIPEIINIEITRLIKRPDVKRTDRS